MRSRKPETRASMLTWRELSVCATNTGLYGIERGSTVMTLTSGVGRGAGGASLPHPATIETAIAIAVSNDARAKRVVMRERSALRVRRRFIGANPFECGAARRASRIVRAADWQLLAR